MSIQHSQFSPDATLVAAIEDVFARKVGVVDPTAHENRRDQTGFDKFPARMAVGLSAGPDSAALAICAAHIGRRYDLRVMLFHIHHGLMPQADAWTVKAQGLAELLGLVLHTKHVQVDLGQGIGVEGAARKARYDALAKMAHENGVNCVLLAHHMQDQAETLLHRMLRGTGVAGAAGMRAEVPFKTPGPAQDSLFEGRWLRPWLYVDRRRILRCVEQFESATGWAAVQDPSNSDTRFARGVIREQLAPIMALHWPGWVHSLARHTEQAREAADLLHEYGQLLLQKVQNLDGTLDLRAWRALGASQQSLVIRTWLVMASVQMPSQRALADLCRQLNQVHAHGHDRALSWRKAGCEITCVRGKIHLQVTMESFGSGFF